MIGIVTGALILVCVCAHTAWRYTCSLSDFAVVFVVQATCMAFAVLFVVGVGGVIMAIGAFFIDPELIGGAVLDVYKRWF